MSIYNLRFKYVLGISFLYSAGALLMGRILQFLYHLKPCPLCLYQQGMLMAVVLLSLILGGIRMYYKKIPSCLMALVPLLILINFGLAVYHVGVEHHIFTMSSQCQGNLGQPQGDINALRTMLLETEVMPCDQVKWSFMGISMAGYNAFFSLILLGMWIWTWLSRSKKLKEIKDDFTGR